MTMGSFSDELHREFDWRWDELNSLKNVIATEQRLARRELLRKSLVVVLYSHFEGFCVFALEHYVTALNRIRLVCSDVNSAILAGAWEQMFNAMEHGDQKCKIFSRPLPNDVGLHRHWRRRHFVEEIDRLFKIPMQIPEDVIDTESNLKPHVLERNLFLLGLDHAFVVPYADVISNLLGRRNRIAHGDDRRGVPETEYDGYESAVFEICVKMIGFLEDAFNEGKYRRQMPEFMV